MPTCAGGRASLNALLYTECIRLYMIQAEVLLA